MSNLNASSSLDKLLSWRATSGLRSARMFIRELKLCSRARVGVGVLPVCGLRGLELRGGVEKSVLSVLGIV